MKTFVICYDLYNAEDRDYEALAENLENLGAVRQQKSTWTLDCENNSSPISVMSKLLRFMDSNDEIFVAEIRRVDDLPVVMKNPTVG